MGEPSIDRKPGKMSAAKWQGSSVYILPYLGRDFLFFGKIKSIIAGPDPYLPFEPIIKPTTSLYYKWQTAIWISLTKVTTA